MCSRVVVGSKKSTRMGWWADDSYVPLCCG